MKTQDQTTTINKFNNKKYLIAFIVSLSIIGAWLISQKAVEVVRQSTSDIAPAEIVSALQGAGFEIGDIDEGSGYGGFMGEYEQALAFKISKDGMTYSMKIIQYKSWKQAMNAEKISRDRYKIWGMSEIDGFYYGKNLIHFSPYSKILEITLRQVLDNYD